MWGARDALAAVNGCDEGRKPRELDLRGVMWRQDCSPDSAFCGMRVVGAGDGARGHSGGWNGEFLVRKLR